MHIISPPFHSSSSFFLQENMAAVYTCFVPHAALTSLEVVSHTDRGYMVRGVRWRGVRAHQLASERLSLAAAGVKAPLCVSLFVAVGS